VQVWVEHEALCLSVARRNDDQVVTDLGRICADDLVAAERSLDVLGSAYATVVCVLLFVFLGDFKSATHRQLCAGKEGLCVHGLLRNAELAKGVDQVLFAGFPLYQLGMDRSNGVGVRAVTQGHFEHVGLACYLAGDLEEAVCLDQAKGVENLEGAGCIVSHAPLRRGERAR